MRSLYCLAHIHLTCDGLRRDILHSVDLGVCLTKCSRERWEPLLKEVESRRHTCEASVAGACRLGASSASARAWRGSCGASTALAPLSLTCRPLDCLYSGRRQLQHRVWREPLS